MSKKELERFKIEQAVKLMFFFFGLLAAFVLALVESSHATSAFTFIGGLLGGSALEKKIV